MKTMTTNNTRYKPVTEKQFMAARDHGHLKSQLSTAAKKSKVQLAERGKK